jgi:hypothetical protein
MKARRLLAAAVAIALCAIANDASAYERQWGLGVEAGPFFGFRWFSFDDVPAQHQIGVASNLSLRYELTDYFGIIAQAGTAVAYLPANDPLPSSGETMYDAALGVDFDIVRIASGTNSRWSFRMGMLIGVESLRVADENAPTVTPTRQTATLLQFDNSLVYRVRRDLEVSMTPRIALGIQSFPGVTTLDFGFATRVTYVFGY